MSATSTPGPFRLTSVAVFSTVVLLALLVVAGHTVRDTVEYVHPTLDLTRVLWQWGTLFVTTVAVFCIWYYYARENETRAEGTRGHTKKMLKRDPSYHFEPPQPLEPIPNRFPGSHVINMPVPNESSAPSSSSSQQPMPRVAWTVALRG